MSSYKELGSVTFLYALLISVSIIVTPAASSVAGSSSFRFSTEDAHMVYLSHNDDSLKVLLIHHQDQLMGWVQQAGRKQECHIQQEGGSTDEFLSLQAILGYDRFSVVEADSWREKITSVFGWNKELNTVDFSSPKEVFQACRNNPKMRKEMSRSRRADERHFIMPSTKWCGSGNIAKALNETGEAREADHCCRAHDHCPLNIRAFESLLGFKNWKPFTISSCECDDDFYLCLQNANRRVADQVGRAYFNVLKMQCFQVEQKQGCVAYYWGNLFCKRQGTVDSVQLYNGQTWH